MSILKLAALIAPLALSAAALAQPTHFTDAQYIAAARCQGLMSASALGHEDTRSIDALMKSEGGIRIGAVLDRADEARADAIRAANHAGAYARPALIAERDGACAVYAGAGTQSASTSPSAVAR